MRKKLSMLKWPKVWLLLVVTLLLGTGVTRAQSVDFMNFTQNPSADDAVESLTTFSITWNNPSYVVTVGDLNPFPNPYDPSQMIANIWVNAPSGVLLPQKDFTVTTSGNTLTLNFNKPVLNTVEEWDVYSNVVIQAGGISINGESLPDDLWIGVVLSPSDGPKVTVPSPPTTVPAWGTTPTVSSISDITLSWGGLYVASDTGNGLLNNIAKDIKIYQGPLGSKYSPGWMDDQFTALDIVASVEGVGQVLDGIWYPSMKINLREPITDTQHSYTLYIPSYSLKFYDKNLDMETGYSEAIDLYYAVASIIVIPGQYQHINYRQFKGLQIEGGNYTVANAAQIGLYRGWFDTDNPIGNATPIATGESQGSNGNILIAFPAAGNLTSGNYTINVPNGAITGFSVPVSDLGNPAGQIQFVIEGNDPTIESLTVGADPANNATVETLESVNVWWGNHNKLFNPNSSADPESGEADNTPIPGTMSVNGGEPQNVNFYITRTLIASAEDEDTGEADGTDYEYSLTYKPATPITVAGKYTFTIPANSVNVYINNFASPANNQVVLNYNVEGVAEPEPEGTNVTLSFTGVENAWELFTLLDGNTAAPIDLDGATYELSFDGDDASLLVGISSEYDLAITAEGVQESYDTFLVGEIEPMEDMDVYPVTIYPGLNGKTLVFTVSKEASETVNKLYVAQGPDMDNIVADPTTDVQFSLQSNGTFAGKFNVEKGEGNTSFRFYSINSEGVYTYYTCDSGGFGANWKLDFSSNNTASYTDLMPWSKSNAGSWTVAEYPEGYVGGEVAAVVKLPVEVMENGKVVDTILGTVDFTFTATETGTPDLPEELYVLVAAGEYAWSDDLSKSPATFKLGADGTYEGDFNVGSNTYFKFFGVDNGTKTWYSSQPMFEYEKVDFSIKDTYTYNTITTATNSAMGIGGWEVAPNTTIHAVVDLVKKTVVLTKVEGQEGPGGDEDYPENVYIVWAKSSFSTFSPSASDQEMINEEDGIFTASFEYSTSDTNKAFRLYSKEDGVITYITPRVGDNPYGQDDTVNFDGSLSKEYTNVLMITNGDQAGSWTIQKFPEGVTEGTIEISLDLSTKTFIITLVPEEVKEPETVYIAFAPHGSSITKGMLNPATDLQFTQQQDGSYLFEYELSDDTRDYFGFLMYTVDGSEYMSIGLQSGVGDWGQAQGIELPNVPGESKEETFTGLKQYPVGPTTNDDQASFTFSAPTGFVSGNATLKLSADLQTLEVFVTSDKAEEPGIQLPEMTANPVDGSTLRNVFAAEPAVRWGQNRLRLVNPQGFSVIQDNGNKNITSDFILQLVEYDPDENTSLEDVQAVISYTDIWPLASGSYTYTINAGAIQINYNGQWVDCPQIVLHYTLGAQQTVTLPPATIVPEDGSKVTDLKNVTLSWPAFYVQQRGNGEGGMLKNITYTVNGGSPKVIDVTYEGDEAPGMEGYYSTIVLPINATESGKYVVTVPAGALYVANQNAGSLENEDIVLTYDVTVTETPAPVYMTGGSVDPRDGSRLTNMGDVYITWSNYTLDINPPANQDYVNLPINKVTATLNGEKVNLNNMFGVIFRAINTQGSDEGNGGTSTFHVAEIQFYPGDLSFYWSGTLNLKFEEGLVKSTTGAISPAFDLTYYLGGQEVVSPAIFTPEEGSKFLPGEAVVYAEWSGYTVTAINGGVTLNTMNEEGEVGSSTSISNSQLSIDGGKLKIDLTSLPAGSYQMWLHQGAVNLGNNAVNADAPYAFSIALPEPEGPEATDITPDINIADGKITISWDGNEIEQTDDFNLTIIDNNTGEEVNIWDGVVSVDDNGNLVIDLEELELPDGDYTLTLAEGSVNIDEDGTITYNNEVTYSFKTSGIDIFTADTEVRYFTIEGVEVKNPAPGQILIRVQNGNKVTKVLVK